MRLLDQIMHESRSQTIPQSGGRTAKFFGLLEAKAALEQCPIRYILDQQSSRQCSDLVNNAPAMFDPADPFLRVAAERMWVEFFTDPVEGASATCQSKVGVLVSADATGRRGTLQGFYEHSGRPLIDHGAIVFDLDRPPAAGAWSLRLRQASLPHLNPLLGHTLLTVRPECRPLFGAAPDTTRQAMFSRLAEGCWYLLPVVLTFSAMLNSGGILREQPSDLKRPNRTRGTARKRSLLDHIEISMQLGFGHASIDGDGERSSRSTPRLHYVRGHVVRRSDKTFWRSSHLRGEGMQPARGRTIEFRSRAQ